MNNSSGNKKKSVCMVFLRHSILDARIYYRESRTLIKAGYQVYYICRLDSFDALYSMSGEKIAYPDKYGVYMHNGIKCYTIKKRKTFFGKLLEIFDLVKAGLNTKANVYHCHETDIALLATIIIKLYSNKKVKFIFDSHEFWSGIWAKKIGGRFWKSVLPFCKSIEKLLLSFFDSLITSDLPTYGILIGYDLKRDVTLIYNSPILSLFKKDDKIEFDCATKGKIILIHDGKLNKTRCINRFLELLESGDDNWVLVVQGGIEKTDRATTNRIKRLKEIGKLVDLEWVEYSQTGKTLENADIGICLLEDHPNYLTAAPNKVFNYMYAGLPIIADNYPGIATILKEHKCGILLNDHSCGTLIKSIKYLINNPDIAVKIGEEGKKAILNKFAWEIEGCKLVSLYSELMNKSPYVKYVKFEDENISTGI